MLILRYFTPLLESPYFLEKKSKYIVSIDVMTLNNSFAFPFFLVSEFLFSLSLKLSTIIFCLYFILFYVFKNVYLFIYFLIFKYFFKTESVIWFILWDLFIYFFLLKSLNGKNKWKIKYFQDQRWRKKKWVGTNALYVVQTWAYSKTGIIK